MTTLRILYSFPHPLGLPGIGTTAWQQVRALVSAGAEVTVVCTSLHKPLPPEVEVHQTLRLAGRRIPHRVFMGSPDRALWYHDHCVARMLRSAHGRFSVVHTWPQSSLATIATAREIGCVSAREVPNTHTANAVEEAQRESALVGVPLPRGHSHGTSLRRLRLEEAEYAQADILLVPSEHVEETFLKRGVPPSRLRRHQYGYDADTFFPSETPSPRDSPFSASFVGRGEPRKGLHYALRAWVEADCPAGSIFHVAGTFVPGYRERISALLDRPSVRCLDFVHDVPTLLRNTDVLILPSVEEGSALVTYEAQASGCIPLVSRAAGALLSPALREWMHQPRDVGTLTRQLHTLSRHAELRAELRAATLHWSERLTWEAAGRRMVEIFEGAIDARAGGAL